MAEKKLFTTIQVRRATTSEWEQHKSYVPKAGEPCLDLITGKVVYGDGTSTYEALVAKQATEIASITGDNDSVVIEDGVVKLAGFDAAEEGAQPRINAEGKLEWFVPDLSAEDVIDKVGELEDAIGDSDNGLVHDIEELQDKMEDVYTREEIDGMIKSAITYQGSVESYDDLEELPSPKQGDVYQVEDEGTMYIYDGDSWEKFSSGIDLSGYENVIETIKVAGVALHVDDKEVDIPIATDDAAGVVMSSNAENAVSVLEGGTMEVNSLNINKLTQDDGDVLVLDGGTSETL